jgi:hypothetical protein
MNIQLKKRVERLERTTGKRRERGATTLDERLLVSALSVALTDYPKEFEETLTHLASGRLGDLKDILKHITTGDEDRVVLTPQAVGGVIHLLMCGALESDGNIADQIREPLIEYTQSRVLQDSIVLLLYDFIGDYLVFRDHPVAFFYPCMTGHGFRIDGRRGPLP